VPPAAPEQVVGWPDEESFCVIKTGTGVVVRASDPRADREIDAFPICDVLPVGEHGMVVFADFTNLSAYGPDGLVWRSDRLVMDELQILGYEGETLRVSGYVADTFPEFAVDIATGVAPAKPDLG
jgi:hypothetical protein